MISNPQNDLRHIGHVGYDGAVFGDVSFIGDNYNKLPIKVGNTRALSLGIYCFKYFGFFSYDSVIVFFDVIDILTLNALLLLRDYCVSNLFFDVNRKEL